MMYILILKNCECIEILSYTKNVRYEGPRENCIQIFFPVTYRPSDMIKDFNDLFTEDNVSSISIVGEGDTERFEIERLVDFMFYYSDDACSIELILQLKNQN